jgi:pentatricopeptide repeat protein
MYSKCGMRAAAKTVFAKLPLRDVVSWNSLIAGCAQEGRIHSVFSIFGRMSREGVRPDPFTFIIILNACSRSGLFRHSERYFDAMSKVYGIAPTPEHRNCMVNLLCRSSRFDEAVAMIDKMPLSPSLVAWHAVLSACKSSGNVDLAKQAFRSALSLDDHDCASYVLMSQIIYSGQCSSETKG